MFAVFNVAVWSFWPSNFLFSYIFQKEFVSSMRKSVIKMNRVRIYDKKMAMYIVFVVVLVRVLHGGYYYLCTLYVVRFIRINKIASIETIRKSNFHYYYTSIEISFGHNSLK